MEYFKTSEIISLLALLVSLAALIIGPMVTIKIARRQIVSPIRQKWIDDIRELISEYLSECQKLVILSKDGILNDDNIDEVKFARLLFIEQKLRLMLNPNENHHIHLIAVIREITEEIHHGVANILTFGEKLGCATQISQTILKEEWNRVKNGLV
jgi:hypothetical protein